MNPTEVIKELTRTLDEHRFRDAAALIDNLDPSGFDTAHAKKMLGLLRRKRQFDVMERAASLFVNAGDDEPLIRRQWAQAVLDQSRVPQALAALQKMAKKHAGHPSEGPEIRGLIGRGFKQLYVDAGGAENLRNAIAAYKGDWENRRGDYRWHGINLTAVAARAERDGVGAGGVDPKKIARALLDDIDEKGATGVWDYATAMEANIALGDCDAALESVQKYVRHPESDAFEIGSTLRQLKEVWQLEQQPCGKKLIPVLEYALMQREGSEVEPMNVPRVEDKGGFEAVWGNEGYTYVEWLDTLYACTYAIARIRNKATGSPEGTGFLVKGSFLKAEWGDAPVLLTNSHVVSMDPKDQAPLRPDTAAAEFTRLPKRPVAPLGELLYTSPRSELDVSVLRLEAPKKSQIMEATPFAPALPEQDQGPQRIFVMGHPAGGELAVSLYDNRLAAYEEQYVRYSSPTKGGSSGSPVCSRQLAPFAIHHSARKDLQLNEGVLLTNIRAAV